MSVVSVIAPAGSIGRECNNLGDVLHWLRDGPCDSFTGGVATNDHATLGDGHRSGALHDAGAAVGTAIHLAVSMDDGGRTHIFSCCTVDAKARHCWR